jgi:acetyl-CoA C-acetyltransferase
MDHRLPPVFVSGAALSLFGRRQESLLDIILEACGPLLKAAGQVDAIVLGAMAPEDSLRQRSLISEVADNLGLSGVPALHVDTASSSGAAAFHVAVLAVAAGIYRRVLVIGAEKLTHALTPASTETMSEVLYPAERLAGLTMPGVAALFSNAYIAEHGIAAERMREAMGAVAVKNHWNATLNPYAHLRQSITFADYLRSRMIASPLCALDCAPISDGAAAVIVTSDRGPVRVAGIGQGTDRLALCERKTLAHLQATRFAAHRAYEQAGFGPEAVTFAELHDAFTCLEIISLEDVGLVPHGCGVDSTLAGVTDRQGRIPVNASGGLKGRGHPVGASGLAQIVEIVWQMQGVLPPDRRVARPEVALALSIGGPAANNLVTLIKQVPERSGATVTKSNSVQRPAIEPPRLAAADTGSGVVLSTTNLYTVAPGFPVPTRLALIETGSGARVLARFRGIRRPLMVGERVKLSRLRTQFRAEAIEWRRFVRGVVIGLARCLRLPQRFALARALCGMRRRSSLAMIEKGRR